MDTDFPDNIIVEIEDKTIKLILNDTTADGDPYYVKDPVGCMIIDRGGETHYVFDCVHLIGVKYEGELAEEITIVQSHTEVGDSPIQIKYVGSTDMSSAKFNVVYGSSASNRGRLGPHGRDPSQLAGFMFSEA